MVRNDARSHIAQVVLLLLIVTTVSAQTRREDEQICSENGPKRVQLKDTDLSIRRCRDWEILTEGCPVKARKSKPRPGIRGRGERRFDLLVSPTDGTVLAFYSGAMGGWKDVTWFALWSRDAAFPQATQCAPSKMVSRALSTASGLGLDLSRIELENLAGVSTKRGANSVKYDYLCRRQMSDEEVKGFKTSNNWDVTKDPYFDRMSWTEAHFKDSKINRIEIGEIESY